MKNMIENNNPLTLGVVQLYVDKLKELFAEGTAGKRKLIPIPDGKNVNPYRVIENDDCAVELVTAGLGVIWEPKGVDYVLCDGVEAVLQAAGIKIVMRKAADLALVRFVKQDQTQGYVSICVPAFKLMRGK